MTYITNDFKDKKIHYVDGSAVEIAQKRHLEAVKVQGLTFSQYLNDDPKTVKKIHLAPFKQGGQLLYCSELGTPQRLASTRTASRSKYGKNGRPVEQQPTLRKYLCIDYDFEPGEENKLSRTIVEITAKLSAFNHIVYPTSSWPWYPRMRLIVDVDEYLDEYNYSKAVKKLIDFIGVDPGDDANTRPLQGMALPLYPVPEMVEASTVYRMNSGASMPLEAIGYEIGEEPIVVKEEREARAKLDPDAFTAAFKDFVKNRASKNMLKNYEDSFSILSSLAAKVEDDELDYQTAVTCAKLLAVDATLEPVPDWVEGNTDKLNALITEYEDHPDAYDRARSDFDIMNRRDFNYTAGLDLSSGNIGAALFEHYPNGDPKEPVQAAANKLLEIFKQSFGIMKRPGSDVSNLAIFDPTRGVWINDDDTLRMLAEVVKPALGNTNYTTLKNYIASHCKRNGYIIKEYTGSRYIVFKNGVLDVSTLDLLPLSSPKVRNLHLTERNELATTWNPDAEAVTIPGKGYRGRDWNIKDYFMAYAGNDEERYRFLMFLLSFGLFGSHTPGVIVSFVGKSGDGKTAMSQWLRNLYQPAQFTGLTFDKLNTPFPLSAHGYHKTVLWVSETNKKGNWLSKEATTFYDGLADGEISLSVKHKGDFVFNPGPTYLDGTATIEAEEVDTGPGRRTIVYNFADNLSSQEVKGKYYAADLPGVQHDSRNLEWFVRECIDAYRYYVPASQIDNFKLNLSTTADVELLPDFAREWRHEVIAKDANLNRFYGDRLADFIAINDPQSKLTWRVLYEFYLSWYKDTNPKDTSRRYAKSLENFTEALTKIFNDQGLQVVNHAQEISNGSYTLKDGTVKSRTIVKPLKQCIDDRKSIGIDQEVYQEYYEWPIELQLMPFGHWLYGKKHETFFIVNEAFDGQVNFDGDYCYFDPRTYQEEEGA